MSKPMADVLAESREYIEKHDWCTGSLRNYDGRVCGMGAVVYSQGWVTNDGFVDPTHLRDVSRVLGRVVVVNGLSPQPIPFDTTPFIEWNDHQCSGKQEILDAFAKAEKVERAGFDPDA